MRHSPNIVRGICAGILIGLCDAPSAAEPSLAEIEYQNALTTQFRIPHTKWAKPYARGKVRVLFFEQSQLTSGSTDGFPQWFGTMVDEAALAQRFDLDADAALFDPAAAGADGGPGKSGIYGGLLGEQRLERLLETPYDCYVFSTETLIRRLPSAARDTIMQHARDGAGILINGEIGEDLESQVEPLGTVPPELAGLDITPYAMGNGRVAAYRRRGVSVWGQTPTEVFDLAPIFGVDLPFDIDKQFEGRALFWTAQKEPELKLTVTVGDATIPRVELSSRSIELAWNGETLTAPLELAVRLRSQSLPPRQLPTARDLPAARGTKTYKLPVLSAGRYWVEVIARSDRGTEAWAVTPITVSSVENLRTVRFKHEWGEAGTPIEGTVDVDTPHRTRRTLHVQAIDRYGRVLSRQVFRSPRKQVAFSIPTYASMPNTVGVEAVLLADGEPLTRAYTQGAYKIPHRNQDRWNFVGWGRVYNGAYATVFLEESLAQLGITSRIETSATTWWFMSLAGMNYTPYCSSGIPLGADRSLRDISFEKYGAHKPLPMVDANGILAGYNCWNDDAVMPRQLEEFLAAQLGFRRHGVLVYSLGDEGLTFGSCLHPACWQKYRMYLESQYRNIDALNASWGTAFTRFGEIEPIIDQTAFPDIKDSDKRQAAIKSYANNAWSSLKAPPGSTAWSDEMVNVPRWFDRRAFQFWNYGQHVDRFRAATRSIDPQALTGPEGTAFGLDQDIDRIVRHTDWWVVYDPLTLELIRSIAPPDYMYGKWTGYSDSEHNMSDWWWSFLRGSDCAAWWRVDHYVNARADPGRGRGIVESAQVVFDGLGTLLNVRSKMQHDRIVMLHSFPSAHASKFEAGPTYGTYTRPTEDHGHAWDLRPGGNNHRVWHRTIRSLGLQFEYVTDRMLQRGEFDPGEYAVLILSQCEALGPQEAQVIRDFASAGGTVIADVRPGLYDGHCKLRSRGILDDLFGVEHTDNVPAKAVEGGTIAGRLGDELVAVDLAAVWETYPDYYKWLHGDLDRFNKSRKKSFKSFEEGVPRLRVNPAVRVTSGTPLGTAGETPICIVNDVGRGRAILLNFPISAYPQVTIPQTPEACADFLKAMFASAGVTWPLQVTDSNGDRHRNVEAVRWDAGGGIEVVAVFGPMDAKEPLWKTYREGRAQVDRKKSDAELAGLKPVRVNLPEAKHIVRIGGESAGATTQITLLPRPWRPEFLVLSDRQLQAPKFSTDAATAVTGQILQLEIEIPDARGLHAVKLRGTDPDGTPAAWLNRSLIVKNGSGQIDLPIAHNERHGKWSLSATDLYTGSTADFVFSVEAPGDSAN